MYIYIYICTSLSLPLSLSLSLYTYVYIYIYIHRPEPCEDKLKVRGYRTVRRDATLCYPMQCHGMIRCVVTPYHTSVCEKNTPSENNRHWNISFQITKSGAGEQFLPLDCRARARRKGVFLSQTLVWYGMVRHGVGWRGDAWYGMTFSASRSTPAFAIRLNSPQAGALFVGLCPCVLESPGSDPSFIPASAKETLLWRRRHTVSQTVGAPNRGADSSFCCRIARQREPSAFCIGAHGLFGGKAMMGAPHGEPPWRIYDL